MLWSVFALWLVLSFPLSSLTHLLLFSLFSIHLSDSPYIFCCPICCATLLFLHLLCSLPPSFLSFSASALKLDLNGWGHAELSTVWSYGLYFSANCWGCASNGNFLFCNLRRITGLGENWGEFAENKDRLIDRRTKGLEVRQHSMAKERKSAAFMYVWIGVGDMAKILYFI